MTEEASGTWQALVGDYRRHGASLRQLSFWALATWRLGKRARELSLPSPLARMSSAVYAGMAFAVKVMSGVEIDRAVRAGEGLHLVHGWNIKIHHDVVLGEHVGIMHDVTIGTNMNRPGVPVIGDRVFIGAGARVLGPIRVGDDACIAANSLVISDVPAGAVAVGVPARCALYRGAAVAARDMPSLAGPPGKSVDPLRG